MIHFCFFTNSLDSCSAQLRKALGPKGTFLHVGEKWKLGLWNLERQMQPCSKYNLLPCFSDVDVECMEVLQIMLIGEVQGRGRKPFQHHGKCPTLLPPTGDTSHYLVSLFSELGRALIFLPCLYINQILTETLI